MERHEDGDPQDYLAGRRCCHPKCGVPILDNSMIEVCYDHGMEIGRHFLAQLTSERREAEQVRQRERAMRWSEERMRRRLAGELVVYYVRLGDYVKIGYTKSLRERMRNLRVAMPEGLLAIEPGGPDVERQRHQEFATERVHARREDFRPSDRLMAHIAALAEEHALPEWARLPDTLRVSVRHAGDLA